MKMIIFFGVNSVFLRDFDLDDMRTFVEEGTPVLIVDSKETADMFAEEMDFEYETV